ncbi:MAG: serine/threonine-protein kinase [Smithella sp.]
MVIGQYKILEKIGEGGMGVIYKGEHSTLHQIVAIKALPSSLSSNPDIRERFLREATIQAKIFHPNIVNILNFFEFDGNYYIVMEYVDGETLESMIKRMGLIPPDRCISLFEQISVGIAFAHSRGIIHRDIKPSNIMVNVEGKVKIMDFGIAKVSGGLNLTKTGSKVGTVWYMSPEQIKGYPADVTTDIYSLGVTLFEMITGRVPFNADSEYEVMKGIVETRPSSPKIFYPYIPESMDKAILKALAKSPRDRFQSVTEFAAALMTPGEALKASEETKPFFKKISPMSPLKKIILSRKQLLLSGTILLVICGSLTVFAIIPKKSSTTIIDPESAFSKTSKQIVISSPVVPPIVKDEHKNEAVIKEKEKNEEINLLLAQAKSYHDNRRYAEAKREYEKVLKIDANNQAAIEGNKINEAEKIKKENTAEISHIIARAKNYHENGKYAAARREFNKVLKINANNGAAMKGIEDANRAEKAVNDLLKR